MSYADDVREYCKANIEPSRRREEKRIAIRAGDIRTAMGYKNRMPLVCTAPGAKKFEEFAGGEGLASLDLQMVRMQYSGSELNSV